MNGLPLSLTVLLLAPLATLHAADPAKPTKPNILVIVEKWNKRNIAPLWHGGQTEDPTAPDPKEKR